MNSFDVRPRHAAAFRKAVAGIMPNQVRVDSTLRNCSVWDGVAGLLFQAESALMHGVEGDTSGHGQAGAQRPIAARRQQKGGGVKSLRSRRRRSEARGKRVRLANAGNYREDSVGAGGDAKPDRSLPNRSLRPVCNAGFKRGADAQQRSMWKAERRKNTRSSIGARPPFRVADN